MMHEEHMSEADPSPPDSFDDAFADNLALVLEMLDCMRSESEFAERLDEAEFLAGVGKALAIFARVQCRPEYSFSQRSGVATPAPWKG
ncbi:MAG: hypothetical protein HY287_02425 [Planctomycetes bacterium]|nr:hypothetical protein [Planctomycetota bacterium]MBI3833165.1 hypothetical protein [Planctomycetota bacterium]